MFQQLLFNFFRSGVLVVAVLLLVRNRCQSTVIGANGDLGTSAVGRVGRGYLSRRGFAIILRMYLSFFLFFIFAFFVVFIKQRYRDLENVIVRRYNILYKNLTSDPIFILFK